jgi:hypothetical protein
MLGGITVSCTPPPWFDQVFTAARLAPYQEAAARGGTHVADLYRWNLQVSEAFLPALSCLEICMRNAMHEQLTAKYHRADWWTPAPLGQHEGYIVQRAREDLLRRKGTDPGTDDIVAELSFGFWVSLLSRHYDRRFWVPALHKAFPGYRGSRKDLHDNFDAMRRFRNRVMHHEPVHHRHLAADHAKIYRLLGSIEPEATAWLLDFDRVPEILAKRPGHDDRG